MPTRHRTCFASLMLLALVAAGCGGASDTPAAKTGEHVTIDTFMFGPKLVHAHVGDRVTWTNKDDIVHTVTSGTREYEDGNSGLVRATHKDGAFDMELDGRGATATFVVTEVGSFHYFCDNHPGMEADIEVS